MKLFAFAPLGTRTVETFLAKADMRGFRRPAIAEVANASELTSLRGRRPKGRKRGKTSAQSVLTSFSSFYSLPQALHAGYVLTASSNFVKRHFSTAALSALHEGTGKLFPRCFAHHNKPSSIMAVM